MPNRPRSARQISRDRRNYPFGRLVALATAVVVTLVGAVSGHEPLAILVRATASSIGLGVLSAIGLGVVRMSDGEQKRRRKTARQ